MHGMYCFIVNKSVDHNYNIIKYANAVSGPYQDLFSIVQAMNVSFTCI